MQLLYHLLNGDSLAEQLRLENLSGELVVFRESFIDGSLEGNDLQAFWATRAHFISTTFGISALHYFERTVDELNKLQQLPEGAEVYLWFGNDLFCQVNMWFVIELLAKQPHLKLYRIFPDQSAVYGTCRGFASLSAEKATASRVLFSNKDRALGVALWSAYKTSDFEAMNELSKKPSAAFRYLPEVVAAHKERFSGNAALSRPELVVKELLAAHGPDFATIFARFSEQEPIYGFADIQVKALYDKVRQL